MMLFSKAASTALRCHPKSTFIHQFLRRTVSSYCALAVSTAGTSGTRLTALPKYYTAPHAFNAIRYSTCTLLQNRTMVTVTVTQSSKEEPTQQKADSKLDASAPTDSTSSATHHNVDDLTITQSCIARIQQLASQRPNPDSIYLRLYVDAGGCSGFQYKFLLLSEDDTNPSTNDEEDGTIDPEEDVVYNINGSRLVIDQTSLELLRGSTIDYVQEMIRSSFAVVNNPNSESACGCGSSFAVKKFEANPALD
eukprot:scaffold26348_cov76-Cyclotella_meneghiniana.AAC.8